MEDILQQETREKIETFPTLGYYFVVFRALDETYYKYTSPVTSPANVENLAAASKMADKKASNESGQKEEDHASTMPSRARGRFDIVERVGGKEGVEGVGVGAVNLYLVVFADVIISVSFI
jgi:Mg2+ and Co2+ transporter CorA